MKDGKAATMKNVAQAAGVTITTVSLVLNKNPKISPSTRDKVLAAAERLGYRRNPYVSALVANRRSRMRERASSGLPVLAMGIFSGSVETTHGRDYVKTSLEGASGACARKGYRFDEFRISPRTMSARRFSDILRARNLPGILLMPMPDLPRIPSLDWSQLAVVSLGFALEEPAAHCVACDHFHSMLKVIRECQKAGCQRMGLVLAADQNPGINRRWLAPWLVKCDETAGSGRRLPPLILERWNDRLFFDWMKKNRPDVIVTPWGGSLRRKMESQGWNVPADVGLVSLDAPDDGSITGIFQNSALLAARAADLLIEAVEQNERGLPEFPNSLLIEGLWMPGKTLGGTGDGKPEIPDELSGSNVRHHVSMRDIAVRLGLDVSTVSLSLRDAPRISKATREKVKAAAVEMGYRKNPYISLLMGSSRSGKLPRPRPLLGFVTAFPAPGAWREALPTIAHCFRGARKRAGDLGFRLEEVWLPDGGRNPESARAFSRKLKARSIQGLLFAPLPVPDTRISMDWEDFCLVAFGLSLGWPNVHRVTNDHHRSMRQAMQECHRLGYRRVGLAISSQAALRVRNRWLAAYFLQLRELDGLLPLKPLVAEKWNLRELDRWIGRSRPDVIISPNPDPILEWLEVLGHSVPAKMGFVSLSSPGGKGSVSGIYQNTALVGARAADILISLIERNEYGVSPHPETLMIDGIWSPGRTVSRRKVNGLSKR